MVFIENGNFFNKDPFFLHFSKWNLILWNFSSQFNGVNFNQNNRSYYLSANLLLWFRKNSSASELVSIARCLWIFLEYFEWGHTLVCFNNFCVLTFPWRLTISYNLFFLVNDLHFSFQTLFNFQNTSSTNKERGNSWRGSGFRSGFDTKRPISRVTNQKTLWSSGMEDCITGTWGN
jgi:hypothetical protein